MKKPAQPRGLRTALLATGLLLAANCGFGPALAESRSGTTAAEESATSETAPTYKRSRSYRDHYRDRQEQLRKQRKEHADAMRENRERWHSMRRWWRNPRAEDRRQWNKARHQWHRDMMETRRDYYTSHRPYWQRSYSVETWRYYP